MYRTSPCIERTRLAYVRKFSCVEDYPFVMRRLVFEALSFRKSAHYSLGNTALFSAGKLT